MKRLLLEVLVSLALVAVVLIFPGKMQHDTRIEVARILALYLFSWRIAHVLVRMVSRSSVMRVFLTRAIHITAIAVLVASQIGVRLWLVLGTGAVIALDAWANLLRPVRG